MEIIETAVELDLTLAPPPPLTGRDPALFATDQAAAAAIVQAAVSVELFTIPLYMSTMYSIQGTHQINSQGIQYYQGRQWPGAAPSAKPETASEKAFNLMFSVFIQEMLHLQMASNIATALGVQPDFTTSALMNDDRGWTCYGPDKSVIPHIVDLKDTTRYQHTRVNLEALNDNQIDLMCAIEQPEKQARDELGTGKYFPQAPFANWQAGDALPMFGTIGHMYECLARYLTLEYQDGKTLWAKMRAAQQASGQAPVQRDLFNATGKGHPQKEYPHCPTLLSESALADAELGLDTALDIMVAITDQGEGHDISQRLHAYRRHLRARALKNVAKPYREDRAALEADYPSYDGAGQPAPSADAEARATYAPESHYERFESLRPMLNEILTWAQWHAQGHVWTAELLTNADYNPATAPSNIPSPEDVAGALNRLKEGDKTVFSKVAVGAIAGVTTVLNNYWSKPQVSFPYPSMSGSGDRMALCWAVFGQAPDLSQGIGQPDKNTLYHACQGLDLSHPDPSQQCAAIEIYHTCRGSNGCHAQGGCGFVQDADKGGGSCSALRASSPRQDSQPNGCSSNGCGAPTPPTEQVYYSAPSDNKCGGFGGCAVPISASQLFPDKGSDLQMKVFDFVANPEGGYTSQPLAEPLPFAFGEAVYDKAWEAYSRVLAARQQTPGEKPKPTDLRLALPPST